MESGYDWKRDEAEKNLLQTHMAVSSRIAYGRTMAVSSPMLCKLAQFCNSASFNQSYKDGFEPKRYFSIGLLFRNEAVDRSHLAEFHQIEGVVCKKLFEPLQKLSSHVRHNKQYKVVLSTFLMRQKQQLHNQKQRVRYQ
ncbi:hypothetical protein M758_7G012700 [Ceratodon purpureus]|uniref:Phenylalanyl-tRNA synthetase domain-containing protein n=1 Tax=Ceratodon purpureus TaxID=3225 RepID=A0A8T0H1J2_CERPU|nr:hypothetical protein KC19_7G012500 [Ceratodon purpureus]KAG0609772.1 hypothetical protein M758_7G012700 [Ceratodon purpureus]